MSDLLDEVRTATRVLAAFAEEGGVLWPRLATALRATCDDVTRRLTSEQLAILLVGPADGGKRILINVAVGEELLRREAREPRGVVRVRHGADAHYVCELRDGGTTSLAEPLRAKGKQLDEDFVRAERELAEAEREVHDLGVRIDRIRAQRPDPPPSTFDVIVAALRRILDLFGSLFTRRSQRALPAHERTVALVVAAPAEGPPLSKGERFDEMLNLQRALGEAEPRLHRAKDALLRARADREQHVAEQRQRFRDDVRALTDADLRGQDVTEIVIDVPATVLPPGLALVDAPSLLQVDPDREATWRAIRDDLGGCIVVSPGGRRNVLAPDLLARLEPIVPHGVRGLVHGAAHEELATRLARELPALFARIREESPTVVAAHVSRDVRDRLAVLTGACATTEAELRANIVAIEQRRIPSAGEFRDRARAWIGPAIEQEAAQIGVAARNLLRERVAGLEAEWAAAAATCDTRARLDAWIDELNGAAPERLRTICEGLRGEVARAADTTADRVQRRLIDDLHATYPAPRAEEEPSPVVVRLARGQDEAEVPPSVQRMPLATTKESFEGGRVKIGLGGAAAGAAIGSLIVPGLGTAVGAMVGVLAGLVEGTGSLKQQALARVHEHLAAVEGEIAVWLDAAAATLLRELSSAVDAMLERTLALREERIVHLAEASRKAVAREKEKLEELARIRTVLGEQEARFVTLLERTRARMDALAAARPM